MLKTTVGKIVVVDDEVELKNALVESLISQGYDAIGFSSGNPMLAHLRTNAYDILLTDLMMPEMDGISLLRASLEIDPHLICIVMTGQGTIQTAVDAMKHGAFDYVLKPFRLQTLMPVLTRAMNSRHLRLENLQLRETVAIYELGQTVAFTLDPNIIVNKLADAAMQQTGSDEVSILLPAVDGDELIVAAVRGENRTRLLGERIPLKEGIASFVARERIPLILDGEIHDDRFNVLWPRPEITSAISVPMQVANKLIGIININSLGRNRPFSFGQMKALSLLASTAAAALESASLYSQVQEAEKKYRSIFENALEGIFQLTSDNTFVTVNPSLARILGYDSPEEVITSLTDLKHQLFVTPRLADEVTEMIETNGELYGYEFEAFRKDKTKIWLSLNASVVRNRNGASVSVEGTIEEITKRKQAEEDRELLSAKIESQGRRLANIITSVPGVVWEAWGQPDDANQQIDFVSDYVESMLGYSKKEWYGTSNFWLTIVHPDDKQRIAQAAAEAYANGKPLRNQFRWLRKDGKTIWVESHAVVVTDDTGKPLGMRGVNIDISERKQSEAMQVRRARQASLRAEVGTALAESDINLDAALIKCAQSLVDHMDASFARIWTLGPQDNVLELRASAGLYTHLDGPHSRVEVGSLKIGRIAQSKKPHITNNVITDAEISDPEWARTQGMVAFAGYPLLLEGRLVGVLALFARHELEEDTLDSLAVVADIIALGIERRRVEQALEKSEEQLRQSQKLEAVGQLAGGVAHDFNNLLTVIGGYSGLLLRRLPNDSQFRSSVEEIKGASDRAANLTRQLLAFSRKQILQPKVLDLNKVVTDLEKMLRRLIGEDIDLLTITDPTLGMVKADPGQIEQVIMNLIVNARDAMPDGGKITIQTNNVVLTKEYTLQNSSFTPGEYIMLVVTDGGSGMDQETQNHIFEPFFTTKAQGKGTGLGLSTVYGIVKQSGGHILVYSEVGVGTTFKIYLPRVRPTVDQDFAEEAAKPILGNETILLVEDEAQVRRITQEVLESMGYRVLASGNGEQAMTTVKDYKDEIHLAITDVVMPHMGGREFVERLKQVRPTIKVIYMSGYTDDAIVRHGLLDEKIEFVQKPFAADVLARKVRKVLDSTN